MAKILFLDVDGVLNCRTSVEQFEGCIGLDPVFVERAKRIIKETECLVVLSSTWRLGEEPREKVRSVIPFIAITPHIPVDYGEVKRRNLKSASELCERGHEIEAWIRNNEDVVDKYAILDDDSDFLPEQTLFKTSFETGLTEEIAQDVINFLNFKPYESTRIASCIVEGRADLP